MQSRSGVLRLLLLSAALTLGVFSTACAHHYYRVYDPYYSDYHEWNDAEIVYYHQWAREYHRDPDRDFRKLPRGEQEEYWKWRHSHGDHDHR